MLGIATISNDTRETLICEIEDMVFQGVFPEAIEQELFNLFNVLCFADKVMISTENTSGGIFDG